MRPNELAIDAQSLPSRFSGSSDSTDYLRIDKRRNIRVKQKLFKRKRLPTWSRTPCNGYIKHPTAGLLMHPSFYTDHSKEETPHLPYEPEVDDPLCAPSTQCRHTRDCFEMRVAMAVWAHRKGVSYRDAEVIWGVSRSTIQRRRIKMQGRSEVHFLVTPMQRGKDDENDSADQIDTNLG